jgi:hypothetical protein
LLLDKLDEYGTVVSKQVFERTGGEHTPDGVGLVA